MFKYLLFDMDGTITDSRVGITKAVQYSLGKYGVNEPDLKKLESFIGPPIRDSFLKFYPEVITEKNVDEVVDTLREYYEPIGIYENKVYDGFAEMLHTLQKGGAKLAVASSKPEIYVRRILDHFSLSKYFDVVVGSMLDGSREAKEEIVEEALHQLSGNNPDIKKQSKNQIAMIGDRKYDVEGAKKHNVTAVGVRFGFAEAGELEEAGADFIAETVDDLEAYLIA